MKVIIESSHCEYRTFISNATGVHSVLPVIVTENGILDQFARYMHLNRRKSRSWQDASTLAIRLLLEFSEANHGLFDKPRAMFTEFSNSLFTGSIDNYKDPSGLFWHARRQADANKIIGHVTRFSDWLSKANQDSDLKLNPWREATKHEQRLNWAASVHRRDNAFLSHLWRHEKQEAELSREVRAESVHVGNTTPAKTFPENNLDLLLTEGFSRRWQDSRGSTNSRNVLITMLMTYGGLRVSEALSLWSGDVTVEYGEVIVRVYHPEKGLAPDGKSTREVYLQNKYGMKPRNALTKLDPNYLGWKNPLITDPVRFCFEVFFFPTAVAEKFALLWRDYHSMQRVKPEPGAEHPYAFTNQFGQPYSHRSYRDAHDAAVNRIGLVSEKALGTTPHGHRHSYGQRLASVGLSPIYIKNAMHHKSIASSATYTAPTAQQTRKVLSDLDGRLLLQHQDKE